MKVKELIEKLQKLDGNLEVLFYTEDQALVSASEAVKALDLVGISETKLKLTRNNMGKVQLSFTGTSEERSYALFEITSDM